jgi:hypothetical protein
MKRTSQPLRRTPLRKVSTKRARELREYSKKRKVFLNRLPLCQVWLEKHGVPIAQQTEIQAAFHKCGILGSVRVNGMAVPLSCDVHHRAGRSGTNYLDESTWLAVCRAEHEFIHQHPSEARRRGWLV